MKREIVVSGIRPTGKIHLGNYFGALQNFVKMQHEHNCYFFIADYHSLTTHPTPTDLRNNVKTVLIDYLASGLDPEASTIYIQSDMPQVAELYLLLNMNAYVGELSKVASFKDKIRQQPNNINAGLLTYPTLMAADVIIHKATKVPVGKDQEQNLEMMRTFAGRFNRLYNVDYFPEPRAYNFGEDLIKIPGLDGSTKMSKSESDASCIYLSDSPEVITYKVKRAVTDEGPKVPNQPKSQPIENLFNIMSVVSSKDTLDHYEGLYNECTIRYGDMKKQLTADIISFTNPIRDRIMDLSSNDEYLSKVAKIGAEKAIESASRTIKDVREIIGFKSF